MNEALQKYKKPIIEYWSSKTKRQRLTIIVSSFIAILLIVIVSLFATRTPMAPLYSGLTPSETGSIMESLDERGIKSEIADNGTTIKAPKKMVDKLKVELSAEGIPKSGNIDYSFFSENAGFGMTDNEFNVLKLDATQTELANLMKEIDGVNEAKVMINLPEAGIFINEPSEEASASIVLNTKQGVEFTEKQIKSLYHLVSKSIPNLPTDNIVITNQFFEYIDLNHDLTSNGVFAQQMEVKKQIESDIQRQIQKMLGTIMGHDKVVTAVTADIDYTQENREENLVTPVDEENMKGIAISAQRVTETFTGNADDAGGIPQAGDPDDTLQGDQYLEGGEGNGDYEKMEETINEEVNKIHKEIVESPYKIQDLGIQVMVEPPNANDEQSLPPERVADIERILTTVVRASIHKDIDDELSDEAIREKIAVSVQPFNGKVTFDEKKVASIPWWIYIVGGILLFIIAALIIIVMRRRQKLVIEEPVESVVNKSEPINIPELGADKETESAIRKTQLEAMAKDKPDEFAKLLRSWLSED